MFQRRQYLIEPSFQLKYALQLSGTGGLLAAIFGAWMWTTHRATTKLLPLDPALAETVAARDGRVLMIFFGATLLTTAGLGLAGVLLTHRVAGPAFVMARYLGVVQKGAYPEVRPLRSKDELKPLLASLEGAVEALRNRDRAEAEQLGRVVEALEATGTDEALVSEIKAVRDRKRLSAAGASV